MSYNGIPPFRHIPNLDDLRGRYDLSNYIEITRTEAEGGVLVGGPFEFLVGDGIPDMIPEGSISLSGEAGDNSQWVVTDTDGNILGLPPTPYAVDFEDAGEGTCLIWHLSYFNGLEGAEVGNNTADLMGCFDLSNSVEVIRNEVGGRLFMYPNPASSTVYLDMTSLNYNTVSVRIFNIRNVEVFNNTYTNQVSDRGSAIIDVSDYQGGIYLVNATSQNGQSVVGKLVIR